MANSKTKRRSGGEPAKSKKSKKGAAMAHAQGPGQQELHSPWWPLMWMLLPLVACVIYGILTRVF